MDSLERTLHPGTVNTENDNDNSGMPRWVKVFALVAIILIVAFALLHLTGNGPHHIH